MPNLQVKYCCCATECRDKSLLTLDPATYPALAKMTIIEWVASEMRR